MHGTLRVLRVNKVWYNFATVLRLRFAISVSWIYIPQTAALGTAQSCDTWTAEHRKGGGGAKCAVNTITCRVDLSVSAVWIRYQNCCCHWFTSKQMKHLVEKGNRLNLNHLQQVVPLSGLTCDVITIAKPEEPLLRRLTFSPVGLLSSFSLPSLIFFRNLVSVFQQLYQRVIRLLRTTLWSKALHVIKTNTSWLVSSTVPPPPHQSHVDQVGSDPRLWSAQWPCVPAGLLCLWFRDNSLRAIWRIPECFPFFIDLNCGYSLGEMWMRWKVQWYKWSNGWSMCLAV